MRGSVVAWFARGAVLGVAGSLPFVALSALVFRFPVPFVGYMSGPSAVVPALAGALFYGLVFWGFAVQAVLGGVGGMAGARHGAPDAKRMRKFCILFSLLGSAVGILTLAVLDKIIGPW